MRETPFYHERSSIMRVSLLVATSMLAAGVGLVACSSGGTPTVPGGAPSLARAAHSAFHLTGVGNAPDVSCPSQYFICVTVSKKKAGKTSICVTNPSSGCPAPGIWGWSQQIEDLNGKTVKNPIGRISPNPGNPVEDKIHEKRAIKSSHGAVKYQQLIEACNSSSSCIQGAIGIITK
jgi:hypothetical protein